jgi:hypothetical protein
MKKQRNRLTSLKHEFVELFLDCMEDGKIYVSIDFALVGHRCCCGCGNEVITPLSPAEWRLTFDGESISLYPSIGNWSFDCQSHYWIENNGVKWAESWSRAQIEAGRECDRRLQQQHYDARKGSRQDNSEPISDSKPSCFTRVVSWLRTLLRK